MSFGISVSVVITTYNRESEAKRAIQSCLHQTYLIREIIVVEDGSNSHLMEYLEYVNRHSSFNGQILYLRNSINKGLGFSRNLGFRSTTSDYVAFLDDDDFWKEYHLESLVSRIAEVSKGATVSVGAAYAPAEIRFADDTFYFVSYPLNTGDLQLSIKNHGIRTISSSLLISRNAFESTGGFDETLKSSIDHDFWLALSSKRCFVCCTSAPSVITYLPDFRKTMMSNKSDRINGVLEFLTKWKKYFEELWGPKEARAFMEKYYADVVGRLIAKDIYNADFRGARETFRDIQTYSGKRLYNYRVFLKSLSKAFIYRLIPKRLISLIRNIIHPSGNEICARTK